MEENKINMPPPPKELRNMPPPPPPRPQNESGTASVEVKSQADEVPENNKELPENNAENTQQIDVKAEKQQTENNKAEKKVKKEKTKSAGGMKTALYWIGFALSLAAVGVLIYLLIKL